MAFHPSHRANTADTANTIPNPDFPGYIKSVDLDIGIDLAPWVRKLKGFHELSPADGVDLAYAHDMLSVTELSRRCKASRPIALPQYPDNKMEAQRSQVPPRQKVRLVCQGKLDLPKFHHILWKIEFALTGHFRRSMLWLALARSDVTSVSNRILCAEQALTSLKLFRDRQREMSPAHLLWLGITCADMQDLQQKLLSDASVMSRDGLGLLAALPTDEYVITLIETLRTRGLRTGSKIVLRKDEGQASSNIAEKTLWTRGSDAVSISGRSMGHPMSSVAAETLEITRPEAELDSSTKTGGENLQSSAAAETLRIGGPQAGLDTSSSESEGTSISSETAETLRIGRPKVELDSSSNSSDGSPPSSVASNSISRFSPLKKTIDTHVGEDTASPSVVSNLHLWLKDSRLARQDISWDPQDEGIDHIDKYSNSGSKGGNEIPDVAQEGISRVRATKRSSGRHGQKGAER